MLGDKSGVHARHDRGAPAQLPAHVILRHMSSWPQGASNSAAAQGPAKQPWQTAA